MSSSSSEEESLSLEEKGNRPIANSTSVIPRDQTSDFTEYGSPDIRSGYSDQLDQRATNMCPGCTYTHVCAGSDESVCYAVDELARNSEITNFDLARRVE